MDIRFVNKRNEIINATNSSIKVSDRYLIGENEEGKSKVIEEYEGREEAEGIIKEIGEQLIRSRGAEEIIIDLREKEDKE